MVRERASKDRLEEIDDALRAPPGWVDPDTGVAADLTTEEQEWAMWVAAARS